MNEIYLQCLINTPTTADIFSVCMECIRCFFNEGVKIITGNVSRSPLNVQNIQVLLYQAEPKNRWMKSRAVSGEIYTQTGKADKLL